MAINVLQTLEVIEAMENFLTKIRPPENLRNQLDVGYKIEDQSIIIFEIRPNYVIKGQFIEMPIAKTTFVKTKNHWKVFWHRSNLTWEAYPPMPFVFTLDDFTELVKEDKHHCFFG